MDAESQLCNINAYIKGHKVEFLDFGASKGESIDYANDTFCGGKSQGIGLDINPAKVLAMKEHGYAAFTADITKLKLEHPVRFVIMSHFLEHLPGFVTAQKIVEKATNASSEFIFVKQPYFDADAYLLSRGLKLYWSDWKGHYYHMQSIELFKIFRDLYQAGKISRFCIYASGRINSANDDRIHPLNSNKNQHRYDESLHPSKDHVLSDFTTDVFREIIVLATRSNRVDFEALQKSFRWDTQLLDSLNLDL